MEYTWEGVFIFDENNLERLQKEFEKEELQEWKLELRVEEFSIIIDKSLNKCGHNNR